MKPLKTWIFVADGARARTLVNTGPGTGLAMLGEEVHSASSLPTHEIGTERPGRVYDRKGGGRHSITPRVDWHVFEKTQFAKEGAAILNKAALEKAFDRLVLVAPAKTLGDLRAMLNDQASEKVTAEVARDYTKLSLQELEGHLEDQIVL
jgi:protein required for attachment to host cells